MGTYSYTDTQLNMALNIIKNTFNVGHQFTQQTLAEEIQKGEGQVDTGIDLKALASLSLFLLIHVPSTELDLGNDTNCNLAKVPACLGL